MPQIKLAGAHDGATLALGAVQFAKGVSQYMGAGDAAIHAGTINGINANGDADGAPFLAAYACEVVDVAQEEAADPAPLPLPEARRRMRPDPEAAG